MDKEKTPNKEKSQVRCGDCSYFSFFPNDKGHNSPHALGWCNGIPWDGNKGQWAMLEHQCKGFKAQNDNA
jgi:hypothetical protein